MPVADIKHVFVLMLENRSYDHMLGSISITGTDIHGAPTRALGLQDGPYSNPDLAGMPVATSAAAAFTMPVDPGHEFDAVRLQLLGANGPTDSYSTKPIQMDGFVKSYQANSGGNPTAAIMASFAPASVPVLAQLAQNFCVCDHWFSSLPGPTVPNRYFLLAGSSNGDPTSPSTFSLLRGELGNPVTFANGTLFTRIKQHPELSFVIYRGDDFPLALTMEGVDRGDTLLFDPVQFAADCNSPSLPDFIFIEPSYDFLNSYRNGTSQHPLADVRPGEQLMKQVYEGIRGSACWPSSVLILCYDEHGGFYDHVTPPSGFPAPGDVPPKYAFDFTQLGVRVPAVIVSPLISPTIDHTVYDHTSVLATLRCVFPQLGWMTERDRLANDFSHLFTLSAATARTDAPLTLASPGSGPLPPPNAAQASPDPAAQVALAAPSAGSAAAGTSDGGLEAGHTEAVFVQVAARLHATQGQARRTEIRAQVSKIQTKADARNYARHVQSLVSPKRAGPGVSNSSR